jgi:hypothetical protein
VFFSEEKKIYQYGAHIRENIKEIDDYESYLLVIIISNIYSFNTSTWELGFSSFGVTSSLSTEVDKELLLL